MGNSKSKDETKVRKEKVSLNTLLAQKTKAFFRKPAVSNPPDALSSSYISADSALRVESGAKRRKSCDFCKKNKKELMILFLPLRTHAED